MTYPGGKAGAGVFQTIINLAAQSHTKPVNVCACDCGRRVTPPRTLATPACRKRMQRRRQNHSPPVTMLSKP